MPQVVGAMTEFERSLIKDRTRAGLDAARAEKRAGGRPAVMDAEPATIEVGDWTTVSDCNVSMRRHPEGRGWSPGRTSASR